MPLRSANCTGLVLIVFVRSHVRLNIVLRNFAVLYVLTLPLAMTAEF